VVVRKWTSIPALIYQRKPVLWNRVLLAAGWMWLYLLCSSVEPWLRLTAQGNADPPVALLPAQWRVVMAALVFVLGVWRPVAGYAAFIVAIAYPLYLISIYVMALALAILVLCAPVMALYAERGVLYLALLVLLTTSLAPLHLAPLIPLLIGLWWKGAGSWVGGAASALWLKLGAALSGHSTDLWLLYGWRMRAGPVYERFHAANSLQTVALILQPFGIDLVPLARGVTLGAEVAYPVSPGLYVLFNLIQVLAWAAAAFAVSAVLDHLTERWAGQNRAGLQAAVSLLPGLLLIWLGFVALPGWLGVEGPRWLEPAWLVAQTAWLGLVAWGLDALLRYLSRPVSLEAYRKGVFTRRGRRARDPGARPSEHEESVVAQRRSRATPGRAGHRGVRVGQEGAPGTSARQAADHSADILIELD
jgi:hypothetical protein